MRLILLTLVIYSTVVPQYIFKGYYYVQKIYNYGISYVRIHIILLLSVSTYDHLYVRRYIISVRKNIGAPKVKPELSILPVRCTVMYIEENYLKIVCTSTRYCTGTGTGLLFLVQDFCTNLRFSYMTYVFLQKNFFPNSRAPFFSYIERTYNIPQKDNGVDRIIDDLPSSIILSKLLSNPYVFTSMQSTLNIDYINIKIYG